MREIQFRAWNVPMKKMFSAEEMAEDQMTLLPTGNFINVHGGSTKLSKIYPLDVMIPLQFTGLLDKNGKEIYEGDIVITAYKKVFEVIYKAPSFTLNSPTTGSGLITPTFDLKVIGNIYENKELLNG